MDDDLDPEVAAAFRGIGAPQASAEPEGLDPEVAAAFRGLGKPTARMTSEPMHRAPVRRSAPTPVPMAKPPERELTWAETGQGALRNAIPSVVGAGKSMVDAVMHPIKTAQSIGDLGKGAVSQVSGALGATQDAKQKVGDERLIRALEDHYKETYGSVKGFKKAAASDPASIALDASTLAGGAGAVAKGAGFVKTASALGKTASALDPIQNAVRLAKLPVTAAGKAITGAQAITTGKTTKALQMAAEAGKSPEFRDVFRAHMEGRAKPEDINEAAQNALNAISRERGERYVEDMKGLNEGNLGPISWGPVDKALKSNRDDVMFKDKVTGAERVKHREASKALDDIQEEIDFYRNQPAGAQSHTLEGFDALKRTIGDIQTGYRNNPVAFQKATSMYNAVLDAIKDAHPDYAAAMKRYADASKEIGEIGTTFGLSRRSKATSSTVLNRLKRADHDDVKGSLLEELSAKDPRIPYMIAGQELNQFFPGGIRAAMSGPLAAGSFMLHPGAAVASAASMSPRLMGSANYAAGRAAGALAKATKPALLKGAYYANQPHAAPVGAMAEEDAKDKPSLTDYDLSKMAGLSPANPEGDEVWGRMIHQESGGNHLRDGKIITSSAGAMGKAQLMPDTAKAVAASLGKPELADLAFEPTEDGAKANELLGRVYYDSLLEQFGNPVMAAAAYNAGPNRVESAISKSAKDGDYWVNHLPAETRNYVRVVSRGKYASGGKVNGVDLEPLVQRLMNMAKTAKKAEAVRTEPLLGASDDSVARALHVAQQAI